MPSPRTSRTLTCTSQNIPPQTFNPKFAVLHSHSLDRLSATDSCYVSGMQPTRTTVVYLFLSVFYLCKSQHYRTWKRDRAWKR